MKALTLLLGARSLEIANRTRRRPAVPEAPFAPIASTPKTARAWRTWAESGDVDPAAAPKQHSRPAPRFPAAHRGSL